MPHSLSCLTEIRLQQLASDTLSPRELTEIEEHLTSCATCREAFSATAAEPAWEAEVREALSASDVDDDELMGRHSSTGRAFADDGPSLDSLLKLLGPTDDPRMLGRIGSYEIVGLLGRGGMGVVFKGFDAALNRYVAIKMLLPHLAATGAARKRFAREAQAAAAVVDDHVMPIHGVAEWQGMPYLVMPYWRGVSLQQRLTEEGPLDIREVLRIGMQTAAALAAAHAQGLVHRDVKPANILLAAGVERVTLMDFGLARAVDDIGLTRTGVLAGTPQYMSPEQARGQAVDSRSDLFSLGCVLYATCTGRAPFRAETSYGVLRMIIDEEPRPIRELNPDVPEWLCVIIRRLMAKPLSERFASAATVKDLLERCLAHVQNPTAVLLPDEVAITSPALIRPTKSFFSKGVQIMLALVTMCVLGVVGWEATGPTEIAGKWVSNEWGILELTVAEPGEYHGTYSQTHNGQPGDVRLVWSRMERRFNGSWKEGADCHGDISVRLVENEIRGSFTLDASSRSGLDVKPRLGDLLCKRPANKPVSSESNLSELDTPHKAARGGITVEIYGERSIWRRPEIGKLVAALNELKGVTVDVLEVGEGDAIRLAIIRDPARIIANDTDPAQQEVSHRAVKLAIAEILRTHKVPSRWFGNQGNSQDGRVREQGGTNARNRSALDKLVVEIYGGSGISFRPEFNELVTSLNALKGVTVKVIHQDGADDTIQRAMVIEPLYADGQEDMSANHQIWKLNAKLQIVRALRAHHVPEIRWLDGNRKLQAGPRFNAPLPGDSLISIDFPREIEGEWELVSAEPPKPAELGVRHRIRGGDWLVLSAGNETYRFDLRVKPNASPPTIDLTYTDDNGEAQTVYALYRLEGDQLQLFLGAPGPDVRPSSYSASGITIHTYRRVTAGELANAKVKKSIENHVALEAEVGAKVEPFQPQMKLHLELGVGRNSDGKVNPDMAVVLYEGRPVEMVQPFLKKEGVVRKSGPDRVWFHKKIVLSVDQGVHYNAVRSLLEQCKAAGFHEVELRSSGHVDSVREPPQEQTKEMPLLQWKAHYKPEQFVEFFVIDTLRSFDFADSDRGTPEWIAQQSRALQLLAIVRDREQVVKTLLKFVDHSEKATPGQRKLAMVALGGAAPQQVVPLLIKELETAAPDSTERFDAADEIEVLRQIGEEARDAVPALLKLLQGEKRDQALQALAAIAPSSSDVMNAIANQLGNPAAQVWNQGIYEVSRYGELAKPLGPTFVKLLDSKTKAARIWAALALVRSDYDKTLGFEVLLGEVAEGQPNDRILAANALGELGAEAKPFLPTLRSFEKDSSAHLAQAVINAIRQIESDNRLLTHAEVAAKMSEEKLTENLWKIGGTNRD